MNEDSVKRILVQVLGIEDRADTLTVDTPLLGGIPEFDSMAVVSVLTAAEEEFGVVIDDDDVDAETFETLGTLTTFVNGKVA